MGLGRSGRLHFRSGRVAGFTEAAETGGRSAAFEIDVQLDAELVTGHVGIAGSSSGSVCAATALYKLESMASPREQGSNRSCVARCPRTREPDLRGSDALRLRVRWFSEELPTARRKRQHFLRL